MKIVVWFSCGAASAVAAKKTIEIYGKDNVMVVNNPILEEHPDNLRFKKDVENWIGLPIGEAKNKSYPLASIVDVFERTSYMSGINGARCTVELKRKARQQWEMTHDFDAIVLGFTSEEINRHNNFVKIEPYPVIPILIDLGITKQKCFDILADAGILLPQSYRNGFVNANCLGCVKATSPTYWNLLRVVHPEIFQQRAEQSLKLGVKLVRYKGKRIKLSELPPDAKGKPLKAYKMPDCSIFCDSSK